jgi:hypothetical protein
LVATVIDQFGRPVVGQLVSFFGSLGTASPSSGVTNSNGQVSGVFIAGTHFGEAIVEALVSSGRSAVIGKATLLIRDPATAPTLTAVTPAAGPATGGTPVTLTGSNFQPDTLVYFEPTLCENITFVSSTELTCVTPHHFPARVHVAVVNPDNQMDRLVDGFEYEGDTVVVDIQAGWTYLALPLEPNTSYTAESLCADINGQGGAAVEIQRRQGVDWESHLCGDTANNFNIELGIGYQVRSNSASIWTLQGQAVSSAVPLNLQAGWNSISIPHTDAYTAQSLCTLLANQGIGAEQIDRWYAGDWDTHACELPFNNFPIEIGQGYSIITTASGMVTP